MKSKIQNQEKNSLEFKHFEFSAFSSFGFRASNF